MNTATRIYVAGHTGLVGSALVRALSAKGYRNILVKTHRDLDLTDRTATEHLFAKEKPEYIFMAAGKVGGIQANSQQPAAFLRENLMMECNVIDLAFQHKVRKLLFVGCSCLYPKACPQPMQEGHLGSGPLEPTNAAYAVAKLAGVEMCHSYSMQYGVQFICAMAANLYGVGDRPDEDGHVVASLIRRFHEAKQQGAQEVTIWGSGTQRREFLFADDLADALIFLMENYRDAKPINVGTGAGTVVRDLATMLAKIMGFKGRIAYDTGKPDGAASRVLDSTRMTRLGWKATTSLEEGLRRMVAWYEETMTRSCKT